MSSDLSVVTCTAPVNIAVIKYWGKRDETLILPINDSVSVTLSSVQMHAKTSVTASETFVRDRIWLNGTEESAESGRLASCLATVREAVLQSRSKDPSTKDYTVQPNWKVHICSENNFPTAAGLASSAAGYACLVAALAKLFQLEGDISGLARRGSGSACRSVYGGFVRWHMGNREDGTDSIASRVRPASHWPGLRVLICVASDSRKATPSSEGMRNSVNTSQLLKYRAEYCVPTRIDTILKAIQERDFQTFADITMKDSNQMHGVCQDTYPPCVYMNTTSHLVSQLIHQLNTHFGELVACYTFDAGPNACIFLTEKYVGMVAALLKHFFAGDDSDEFLRGEDLDLEDGSQLLGAVTLPRTKGGLKYVIHTQPGEGPEFLQGEAAALLDKNGMPKRLN